MTKAFKREYEQETYWCNKCKRFHRYLIKNKPSITHLEHFCYFYKYKRDYTQSELFKLSFKESWKREKVRQSNNLFIN